MFFYSHNIMLEDRVPFLIQKRFLRADYRKKNHNDWELPIL